MRRFLASIQSHAALWVAACTIAGCAAEPPNGPTLSSMPVPQPPAPVATAPAFPALTRPGDIYAGPENLYDFGTSYHHGRLASRYVLYNDGTFGLQFSSPRFGFFEYLGRFKRADTLVTFDWDGWSAAGPWGATATLRGDSLNVKYNFIMQMTDFVDGEYIRSATTR